MKNKMRTENLNKLDNLLTINNSKHEVLSADNMKHVRGGDGDANGGSEIIMSLPK